MCLLNSLVEISFNVISLKIAVDRRIYHIPDFLHFNCCAPVFDFMHIGHILLIAFSARYSIFVLMCHKTYITHSRSSQKFYAFPNIGWLVGWFGGAG